MSISTMPHEKWLALVNAFRIKPGSVNHAAKVAKTTRKTAHRAWESGYPDMIPIRLPIKVILQQEEEAQRAKVAQVVNETEAFAAALRDDVRNDALDQYQRTTRMVKAATITANNALASVGQLNKVAAALAELAPRLAERIKEAVQQDELDPIQALAALEKISNFTQKITATSNAATTQGAKAVEVERLLKGDATSIIGVKETLAEPISAEEAKRLAAELAEAANEAEVAAGGQPALQVLPGGAQEAQTG